MSASESGRASVLLSEGSDLTVTDVEFRYGSKTVLLSGMEEARLDSQASIFRFHALFFGACAAFMVYGAVISGGKALGDSWQLLVLFSALSALFAMIGRSSHTILLTKGDAVTRTHTTRDLALARRVVDAINQVVTVSE